MAASVFTELALAHELGISGTQGGFSDPLPRFQMLVNLPALFLSALSSRPRALRLHLAPYVLLQRESLSRPAAPIRGLFAGNWACCPPPVPQALFLSTFSQVSPFSPSVPHPLPDPSRACGAPQGVRGSERPSVARGLALVPRLHFQKKLTGAPFRRQSQHNCRRH